MVILNRNERWVLFLGDIVFFCLALWITLVIRYQEVPSSGAFFQHIIPFSILFLVWTVVFFIAGLYEKHTVILKNRLPALLFNSLVANTVIAITFFYFIPYFGIAPKTILFIYLVISLVLVLGWRIYGYPSLASRRKQNALLIASGADMKELRDEVNNNSRYSIRFVSSVDLEKVDKLDFKEEVLKTVYAEEISIVAVDLRSEKVAPILPHLYNLIFSRVRFIDMYKIYEDIFDRVPLSLLRHNWFIENISLTPKWTYDFLKRLMDIAIAGILLIFSLPLYPLVWLAMLFDEGKGLFSIQERVGRNNLPVKLYKFRTMLLANDGGEWGVWENRVTHLGKFLRKTRLDELPQLWNVIKGDISLIGPRPEFALASKEYDKNIPYYNIRYLIKPGLSGWAQIHHEKHPHHGIDIEETKNKLSYDLYYIKNRSFLIDLKIALHTIRELLSRKGS